MMITSAKCRPRNGAGRARLTISTYQKPRRLFATHPCCEGTAQALFVNIAYIEGHNQNFPAPEWKGEIRPRQIVICQGGRSMQNARTVQLAMFAMVVFGGVETALANPTYSFTTIDVSGSNGITV